MRARAEENTSARSPFIGGKTVAGSSGRSAHVFNPNTGEVDEVAFASKAEMEHAIANAEAAQPAWAATNLSAARG